MNLSHQLLSLKAENEFALVSHVVNLASYKHFFAKLRLSLEGNIQGLAQYIRALTHSSFVNEFGGGGLLISNERLEFLGDAILNGVIATLLYENSSTGGLSSEGHLSKKRGQIVSRGILSEIAALLHLDEVILVGKGEEKNLLTKNSSHLGNALEALIGATFLNLGWSGARELIIRMYAFYKDAHGIDLFSSDLVGWDPKSMLQEKSLMYFKTLPEYRAQEVGEEASGQFNVSLFINGLKICSGSGNSKKCLEKELADKALLNSEFWDKVADQSSRKDQEF